MHIKHFQFVSIKALLQLFKKNTQLQHHMLNLFKKKKPTQNTHLDFDTLYALFNYLQKENSYLSIKVKGQKENAEAVWFDIPASFDDSIDNAKALEQNGLTGYYELANKIFEKVNLSTVDILEATEKEWHFDYMQITFYTPPKEENEKIFNIIKCTFYFVFAIDNNAEEINGFRALYRRANDYTINNFLHAKDFININQPDEEDAPYVQQLERNIVALAQYAGTTMNNALRSKYPDSLIEANATLEDFERIIGLINYSSAEADIKQSTVALFASYQKNWNELIEGYDAAYSQYFPGRYEVLEDSTNFWNSDWKFEAADVEWFIQTTLGEDWTFEYPADTFSHNLFPYIQKALEKDGLELLNIDAEGDNYGFFLARKSDVPEILTLSYKLKLGIEQVK